MEDWTKDVSLLVEPLRRLALKSDVGLVRSVLAEAVGELNEIGYDNWNGGTTTYSLTLRLPDAAYLEVQDNLEECEEQILERVKRLLRAETNDFVEQVLIQPIWDGPLHPTSDSKYWLPSHFRLFISHISENKANAGRLKSALEPYGITAFVAHEDIEPTREWEKEIESALFSMDGLIAILARGFARSNWTDHEVGVAIGRELIVVPIMFGRSPYGLMRKYQGVKAEGRMLSAVTEDIFSALISNRLSSTKLVTCLVEQFLLTGKSDDATSRLQLILRAQVVSTDHLNRVRERLQNDEELLADDSLVSLANQLLEKHGASVIDPNTLRSPGSIDNDIPF